MRFSLIIILASVASIPLAASITQNLWPFYVEDKEQSPDPALSSQSQHSLGPIWQHSITPSGQEDYHTLRPLYIHFQKNESEWHDHFLYPLFNRFHNDDNSGWDLFRFVQSYHSAREDSAMIFPFYYRKSTEDPQKSYHGLWPIYGDVRNVLGIDRFFWAGWPLYFTTEDEGITKAFTPWPFIQHLHGPGASGGALWPLYGNFTVEDSYHKTFALWPFYINNHLRLDSEDPLHQFALFPLYYHEISDNKQNVNYLWPFFGYTRQAEPRYSENRYFWPFLVQGRGEGRYVNRWAPFYSHSNFKGYQKTWLLWPLYQKIFWQEKGVDIHKTRILYFLYGDIQQWPTQDPQAWQGRKNHLWPLYTYWNNGQNHTQLQALSPIDVFFPHNDVIRRKYSPLFALFTYQKQEEQQEWQLLWRFINWENDPQHHRFCLGPLWENSSFEKDKGWRILKGFLGTNYHDGQRRLQLFWKTW